MASRREQVIGVQAFVMPFSHLHIEPPAEEHNNGQRQGHNKIQLPVPITFKMKQACCLQCLHCETIPQLV
uniref:Uncharacterized protein n=1 Tax=Talaromyces marneffei PM1 TaxID=1077442 RepID=A0A093VGS6_TALMA